MLLFVGTFSQQGIYSIEVVGDHMRIVGTTDALKNPNYLLIRDDMLYAVGGSGPDRYRAASFHVANGNLELRSMKTVSGGDPCHMALSLDKRFLYTANYMDGTVSAFRVDEGRLSDEFQVLHHQGHGPDAGRQEGPHAHSAYQPTTDPGAVYAIDLGLDVMRVYDAELTTGLLKKRLDIKAIPGGGPRHATFSEDEDTIYLLHELTSMIRVFKRVSGEYVPVQDISMLPKSFSGQSTGAAIRIKDDVLYASNRGHDSIAAFSVLEDGTLASPSFIPAGGQTPRDFVLTPDGRLITVNQDSSTLCLISPSGEQLDQLTIDHCVSVVIVSDE